ncbi:MAG: hypothetical protein AUJ18_10345 [Candidatus Hydrogenedentes bacterium CG1_02_42_14]|nr:MAG: hypothetical protein AUJ18_10345 [Candidatus Hydrogenedentes bacterium CG1_02_42_14]
MGTPCLGLAGRGMFQPMTMNKCEGRFGNRRLAACAPLRPTAIAFLFQRSLLNMNRGVRISIICGLAIIIAYALSHIGWYWILMGRLGDPPASNPHYYSIWRTCSALILVLPGFLAGSGFLIPRRQGAWLLRSSLVAAMSLLILTKVRWGETEVTLYLVSAILGLFFGAFMIAIVWRRAIPLDVSLVQGVVLAFAVQALLFASLGYYFRHLWISSPVWDKYSLEMWLKSAAWGLAISGIGQWLFFGPLYCLLDKRAPSRARGFATGIAIVSTLAVGPLAYHAFYDMVMR